MAHHWNMRKITFTLPVTITVNADEDVSFAQILENIEMTVGDVEGEIGFDVEDVIPDTFQAEVIDSR